MNPNDFMGYPQGQQPQQPMQMPNYNPSMPMQPNFGKGLPNFNPSNMPMNRQNTMNQFQSMQFPGMPNPMNQMQPGGMANPMAPPMNQNMMKQHNMMQPTAGSFGFAPPNNRHRSSLTGMQYNNPQMFPQMIQTQSGTQPPTATLPTQSASQPKKKRSSTSNSQANSNNITSNPPNISSNAASSSSNSNGNKGIQIAPSPSIDNISGSSNSNANITTPISSSIPESTPEKTGSSGSSRGGGNKSGSGSSSQKHSSLMSNQPSVNNLSGIGSMGSMNNLTGMNSMNNLNMGMSSMNSLGNMGNLSQMSSLSGMASMNSMPPMNMNMNMGMNMGMPMGGMNMNNMNVMNGMNMMNSMNPMSLSGMSSMGNLSGMNSMGSNLTGMNSMGSMNGMGSMGNIGNMPSMTGISSSTTNSSSAAPPSSSTSSSMQQSIPSSSQSQSQIQNQSQNSQQSQNQSTSQVQNQQQSQQQPIIPTISVPPQIQSQMSSISQLPSIIGPSGISPEISQMTSLLAKISDDRADLIFSLFDIHQPKKKHDKIQAFIKFVIKNFHPNWVLITLNLIEQIDQSPQSFALTPQPLSSAPSSSSISQQATGLTPQPTSVVQPTSSAITIPINTYQKFKEPPLPLVFSRIKNCKPLFKNLILNQNRLEFTPKNCRKYIVIGSFISANETINPAQYSVSVFCEKNEIQPLNFGDNESYYVLFPEGGKVPQHFLIQITSQSKSFPASFLTWFVCQFVERKNAVDVLHQLLSTTQNEKIQLARTPMCKGCSFYAIHAIEDILKKGFALCPTCHANIILNDLIFDSKAAAPPQQIKIEENKDMKQGRIACSDALTTLMKPSHTEQDWKDILFDQGGLLSKEYTPLRYSNTYEFRNELSQFKDKPELI